MSRLRSPAVLGLVALVAGILAGTLVRTTDLPALRAAAAVIEPLGALWVNAIRMTLVPLVVALIVTSVNSFADARAVSRLGGRTLAIFVVLLVLSSALAITAAPPLVAMYDIDPQAAAALRARATMPVGPVELPTVRGFLVGMIPVNPLRAAVDGAMLPLIVFTALFALATSQLPPNRRRAIDEFFTAVRDAMLVLVRWILALTPIGVFALSLSIAGELGMAAAGALGWYVITISALLVTLTLLLYVVVFLWARVSPRTFARAAAPAQLMAAGSRSSLASLPALIDGARRAYGDRPGITGLVLPLAVSTFKINTPVSELIGPVFLAHLYGIDLSFAQVLSMALMTIALSFSNPGIPSGGLFTIMAPIMMSVGLPLEGIALLIAVDAIPDLFATVANVTGDMAAATIVLPQAPLAGDVPAAAAAVTDPKFGRPAQVG
jgi:proton glutamate symport protein